jgi:hypothetical protein
MKIYGLIGGTVSLVLIDSGSTHNIVSLALAQMLKLQPKEGGGMSVIVAFREKKLEPR